jgi:hypothetical protein
MSFASLQNDSCTYKEKLRASVGPGMYMLSTPPNDCAGGPCARDVPADPYMRWQSWGPGMCPPGAAVDDGSELRGLNYKASKCSSDAYLPGKYSAKGACQAAGSSATARQCAAPTEATRLSNPPCTLRSTGWNRWEWLCWNPQDRALIPFEWNVNTGIVSKDNHVPCIPSPVDQTNNVPASAVSTMPDMQNWRAPEGCGAAPPGNPFAPRLQSCNAIKNL